MPQPQEKIPEPTELPNPELNPLLNPTLGKHLGRWAQVYFTTPPEKREQAVLELLRELEGAAGSSEPESPDPMPSPAWLRQLEEAHLPPARLHCAECGHENAKEQRFCGMCGSPLTLHEVGAPFLQEPPVTPPPLLEEIRSTADSLPAIDRIPTSLFGIEMPIDNVPSLETAPPKEPSEIHWLRDKNLGEEESTQSPSRAKYGIALFVLLAVAVFFYAQARSQGARSSNSKTPAPEQAARPTQTAVMPNPPPTSSAPAPSAGLAERAHPIANSEPAKVPEPTATHPAPLGGAVQNTSAVQPVSVPAAAASGAAELLTAEGYLSGKNGPRDSAAAAQFLWKAVAKENVTATLLLSDLYRNGDGVPKNCDQARILLDAAAQKNSTQAATKLRELQTSGCQ